MQLWKGNPEGRILVVGDGPTKWDKEQGVPFSGPPGWKLKEWIDEAGINLSDILFSSADCFVRSDTPESIQIVVPMGEITKGHWLPGYPKLNKIRGSIYQVDNKYVCPSLHPLSVTGFAGNTIWEHRCRSDWRKIKEVLENGYEPPERNHNINPTLSDIETFYRSLADESLVSLDIETWGGSIKCVGFASNERESIVIPTEEYYWKQVDISVVWNTLAQICEHPCAKVMQNGLFDAWWLEEYGITVENYCWDTLGMHHAISPRDNHALDYLASIYTYQPYWKDEAKEADEIVKVAKQGMDKLYVYNGLDVTVTWEIWSKLKEELDGLGLTEFYHKHYSTMHAPLLRLMRTGVCVDRPGMDEMRLQLKNASLLSRDQVSKLIDMPCFVFNKTQCERDMLAAYMSGSDPVQAAENAGHADGTIQRKAVELAEKGVSDAKLIEFFREIKLPKSVTGETKTGKMKVDNVSLRKIQKYCEERKKQDDKTTKVREVVDLVLDSRRKRKLASFLNPEKIDSDNRLRCTYKFTTKTGRLASSANPGNTGMNLQNIDRELRGMFVASPGRVLLEIDLSQAESRIVGALTGDDEMIHIARRLPTEGDTHTENAVLIYSELWQREVAFDEITKDMRYLGKRAVHASGYGMRGPKLSDILIKEGYTFTGTECQRLIDAYMAQRPAIRAWQSEVRKSVLQNRYLQTSWGRYVTFEYDQMDDELYRFAYSYVPQSEIGDLTNQWMVKPLHHAIKEHSLKSNLIMQVHDAVIVDAVPEECWSIMRFVKKNVERPRRYGFTFGRDVELVVPCEYGIGRTWKKATEWKTLPPKEEVSDTIKEMLNG